MSGRRLSLRSVIAAVAATLTVAAAGVCLPGCASNDPEFYNSTTTVTLSLTVEPWQGTPEAPTDALPPVDSFEVRLLRDGLADADMPWIPWPDFQQGQRYIAGAYTAMARYGTVDDEGVDRPCFEASQAVTLAEGANAEISLTARLASAPVRVEVTPSVAASWPGAYAMIHSAGGAYISFTDDDVSRWAYMRPGPIDIILMIPGDDNGERGVKLCTLNASAAHPGEVKLSAEGTKVTATWGNNSASTTITPQMLAAPAPQITIAGAPDTTLEQPELTAPAVVGFNVQGATAGEAVLTVNSPALRAIGAPSSIPLDPAARNEDCARWLKDHNVELSAPGQALSLLNLSSLLEPIAFIPGGVNVSEFTLETTTAAGMLTLGPTLRIVTLQVDPQITAIEPGVIGNNTARITVEAPYPINAAAISFTDLDGHELPVTAREAEAPSRCILSVTLPEGNTPVEATMLYGGRPVATTTLGRSQPPFRVEADPFAARVRLRVVASTPEESAFVAENASVWLGDKRATVLSRDTDAGIITCIGLTPSTDYKAIITLLADPAADTTPAHAVTFKTESDERLPNGSLDDVEDNIKFKRLPCGGKYSQTIVQIFNCQNYTDYELRTPEKWATVNAKTFCTSSATANTWYMQPSTWSTRETAANDDYGVELQTVGFDPLGPEIPPYAQQGNPPYPNYSLNVPHVAYRAAGKLFLGSYSYNPEGPTETYTEGLPFGSRPMSVNGYYKYYPTAADATDTGIVIVSLEAADGTVIASESLRLHAATDYTAFSLSINYPFFGVKAAKLKLMIASSADIGDIAHETAALTTVDSPAAGASLGSHLYIDNLSLAY